MLFLLLSGEKAGGPGIMATGSSGFSFCLMYPRLDTGHSSNLEMPVDTVHESPEKSQKTRDGSTWLSTTEILNTINVLLLTPQKICGPIPPASLVSL